MNKVDPSYGTQQNMPYNVANHCGKIDDHGPTQLLPATGMIYRYSNPILPLFVTFDHPYPSHHVPSSSKEEFGI
jgi:hypothetical protein